MELIECTIRSSVGPIVDCGIASKKGIATRVTAEEKAIRASEIGSEFRTIATLSDSLSSTEPVK